MSAVTQNVISLSSVYLRGRTFLISVFLILIHLDLRHAFAVQWEVKNFPNPQTDLQDCGRRGKQSFVCDPDGVLSYSEADEIDRVIKQVRNSTGFCICGNKCPTTRDYRGIQPAVALVKKMYVKAKKPGKPTSKEKKKAADDFSDDLRDDRWEYGRCNDDFVIFISTEDRQVYTAVGDKTREMFLSDYCVNTVFNDVKRFFSGKKWAKGIEEMLKAYIAVYRREHRCNKPGDPPSKFTLIILGVLGATGIGSCCLCVFLRQKYGLCKCLDGAGGGGGGSSAKYSSPKHHHHHGGSKRRGSQDSVSSGGGGGEF